MGTGDEEYDYLFKGNVDLWRIVEVHFFNYSLYHFVVK